MAKYGEQNQAEITASLGYSRKRREKKNNPSRKNTLEK